MKTEIALEKALPSTTSNNPVLLEAPIQRASLRYLYRIVSRFFRKKRMRQFQKLFNRTNETSILDVGGRALNWSLLSARPRLTMVNLQLLRKEVVDNTDKDWVAGDGLHRHSKMVRLI